MKKLNFCSLFLLLSLIGCGAKEQFGSTPASESTVTNGVGSSEKLACTGSSLVKPPVDILYVVDNSSSTNYIQSNIKSSIQNTINSISSEFDYRVIGTPLISSSMTDFQILASNPDAISSTYASNKVSSSGAFNFFQNIASGPEAGFSRVISFANFHKNGILRKDAHTIVVLISNGHDSEVVQQQTGGTYTYINDQAFAAKFNQMNALRATLESTQFRFMSVVAHKSTVAGCSIDGSLDGSVYKKMSKDIYSSPSSYVSGQIGSDNNSLQDSYDLCNNGFSSLFTAVNSSIKQVRLTHTYQYWPVTGGGNLDPSKLQVYKQTDSTSVQLLQGTDWTWLPNNGSVSSRSLPTPGETISGNMIQFLPGKEVVYPACVVIKSTEYTEYFKYAIIARDAVASSIVVRVNGQIVPATGYEYRGLIGTPINIKVAYNGSPATPEVKKSGYMIEFKSPHYYKSGDNVEVFYQSAGI